MCMLIISTKAFFLRNMYIYDRTINCIPDSRPVANNDTPSTFRGRKPTSQETFADMTTATKRRSDEETKFRESY